MVNFKEINNSRKEETHILVMKVSWLHSLGREPSNKFKSKNTSEREVMPDQDAGSDPENLLVSEYLFKINSIIFVWWRVRESEYR